MTVPERVSTFLTDNRGKAFCDDCLKDRLRLARRQQAQQATSALATAPSFRRQTASCSRCGDEKLVIWAKA